MGEHYTNKRRRGIHRTASSSSVRRRHILNNVMKFIMTIVAIGVVGLVYWLYTN